MSERNEAVYKYECDDCHDHFEVVMTFHEQEPFDRDEQGRVRSAGYPEQQPECPTCHSHDVIQVELREAEELQEKSRMNAIEAPTIDTTIGDLVAQRPSRSRVFEKLGIDYCCGGKRPLAEACAAKGLDAETVLTILLAAEEGTGGVEQSWTTASLADLIEHIVQTHHAYLKRELPRLHAMVRKVSAVHGSHYPWLHELEDVYNHFATEMESHLMKEEQVLFPRIRCLESGESAPLTDCGHGIGNPIRVMEFEHDDAGDSLARMRELSQGFTPPPDACNTFCALLDGLHEMEQDIHRHVHKENNILFPKALELEQQFAGSLTD